jgi:DNA repair exonuclease SbcCD ATPase subunit
MVRQGRLQIVLLSTLGVALVVSVGMILRQSRRLAADQRQRDTDLKSIRELREALRQRGSQETPAEAGAQTPVSDNQAALGKRAATIERLNRNLTEAHANITELQEQLLNSNNERERAIASANERHSKVQEELQSQLDTLKQELDSAQAESRAFRQRTSALEADNAKLRSVTSGGSASAPDFGRLVADLQDLDRRREAYLTSIMRRYRDITSQFRAMSGMLDSSRDPNSSSFSGAALTRIQDAVSLADDDLRQLNELNAQARQLEKKLVKK